MSGRRRVAGRAVVAAAVGALILVPGAIAHVAAGGSLAVAPVLAALAVAAGSAALAGSRLRWTFVRLAALALAAQPALHVMLTAGAGSHGGGHHRHGAHSAGQAAGGGWLTGGWLQMALAHTAVGVAGAAALRWGVHWLRTMPALARALLIARPNITPAPHPWFPLPPRDTPHRDLAVLAVRASRGPPR